MGWEAVRLRPGIIQQVSFAGPGGRTWAIEFDVDEQDGKYVYRGVLRGPVSGDPDARLTQAVVQAFAEHFPRLVKQDTTMRDALRRRPPRLRRTGPRRKYASKDVARVWRQATKKQKPLGQAFRDALGVSPAHASQLIARARKEVPELFEEGER